MAAAGAVAWRPARARADADDAEFDADGSSREGRAGKPGGDACIDEDVKADLFAKRKQRTSRDRLFQQTNRHELTLPGGYYVSDLFDGTYTARRRVRVPHDRGPRGRGHGGATRS